MVKRMSNALGMLEVYGFSVALAAADRACKEAAVTLEGIDCNNPAAGEAAVIPLVVQVKLTGGVTDVEMAVQAAKMEALKYLPEEAVKTSVLTKMDEGLLPFLGSGKVKKKVSG
jgi:microcompartment protein CcmL/EutN